MKFNIKNIIICSMVFLIIFLSFCIPNILFELEDLKLSKQNYQKARTESKIDVQAQNIYLVKAIHDIEDRSNQAYIGTSMKTWTSGEVSEKTSTFENIEEKNIRDELLTMKNSKILGNILEEGENLKYSFEISEKKYQYENVDYVLERIYIKSDEITIGLDREKKTGKILYITFPKSKLINGLKIQEILENFVTYLDLYIIDDWYFKNNMLISEKARVIVTLPIFTNDTCFLSIHSIDNYLIEYYKLIT